MQETEERQGESLGWEDPLEEGLAVHYSILAWRIPRTEEQREYSLWGCKESDTTKQLTLSLQTGQPQTQVNSLLPPAWPRYTLGDWEVQPQDGCLTCNTILHLHLHCRRLGKWSEVPDV